MNKFYTKNNNLIIEIPLEVDQYNPYMGDEPIGKTKNICGVIDTRGGECGLAYLIDRSYKGKKPDISTIFFHFDDEEELKKTCKEIGLDVVYMKL